MPEGTKDIKVGTLIALTVEVDEDWKTVETPNNPSAQAPSAASSAEPSSPITKAEPPPGQYESLISTLDYNLL